MNHLLITSTDGAGTESAAAPLQIAEDSLAPVIGGVSLAPDTISAGGSTTLAYTLSETAGVTVAIQNSAGQTIRTLISNERRTAGQRTEAWDGHASNGSVVPTGTYKVLLDAIDPARNQATQATATVTVTDSTQPPGQTPAISDPGAGVVINAASYTVKGTAVAGSLVRVWTDANGNGVKDAGETALLGSQQLNGSAADFSISVALTRNTVNRLLVTATNGSNQESTAATAQITEDSLAPAISGLAVTPALIAPNGGTTIAYTLSEAANVGIVIQNGGGQPIRTLVNNGQRADGSRTESWDGRDDNGGAVAVGEYRIVVNAADAAHNQATQGIAKVTVAGPCNPCPNVLSQPVAGGGSLQVTIVAATSAATTTNALKEIRFTRLDNATVEVAGRAPSAAPFSISPSAGTQQLVVTIRRTTSGQAATVYLDVVDQCGVWQTFVGGGPNAF